MVQTHMMYPTQNETGKDASQKFSGRLIKYVFFNILNIHSRNSDHKMLVPANPHKPLALHFDKNACVPHTLGLQTGALETVL